MKQKLKNLAVTYGPELALAMGSIIVASSMAALIYREVKLDRNFIKIATTKTMVDGWKSGRMVNAEIKNKDYTYTITAN